MSSLVWYSFSTLLLVCLFVYLLIRQRNRWEDRLADQIAATDAYRNWVRALVHGGKPMFWYALPVGSWPRWPECPEEVKGKAGVDWGVVQANCRMHHE